MKGSLGQGVSAWAWQTFSSSSSVRDSGTLRRVMRQTRVYLAVVSILLSLRYADQVDNFFFQ